MHLTTSHPATYQPATAQSKFNIYVGVSASDGNRRAMFLIVRLSLKTNQDGSGRAMFLIVWLSLKTNHNAPGASHVPYSPAFFGDPPGRLRASYVPYSPAFFGDPPGWLRASYVPYSPAFFEGQPRRRPRASHVPYSPAFFEDQPERAAPDGRISAQAQRFQADIRAYCRKW